jgi:hypothetical protein
MTSDMSIVSLLLNDRQPVTECQYAGANCNAAVDTCFARIMEHYFHEAAADSAHYGRIGRF